MITAVVGCLFDKQGNILVIQNDRGWDLPGGHIEKGENTTEALIREAQEEAGAEVKIIELIDIIFPENSKERYKGKGIAFIKGTVLAFDPQKAQLMPPEKFLEKYQQNEFKPIMKKIITKASCFVHPGGVHL